MKRFRKIIFLLFTVLLFSGCIQFGDGQFQFEAYPSPALHGDTLHLELSGLRSLWFKPTVLRWGFNELESFDLLDGKKGAWDSVVLPVGENDFAFDLPTGFDGLAYIPFELVGKDTTWRMTGIQLFSPDGYPVESAHYFAGNLDAELSRYPTNGRALLSRWAHNQGNQQGELKRSVEKEVNAMVRGFPYERQVFWAAGALWLRFNTEKAVDYLRTSVALSRIDSVRDFYYRDALAGIVLRGGAFCLENPETASNSLQEAVKILGRVLQSEYPEMVYTNEVDQILDALK